MKELFIDTSILIDFFQENIAPETETLIANSEPVVSAITFHELYKFLLNTGKTHLWNDYKNRISRYKIINVDKEVSENAALLGNRFGLSLGDSLIYASAQSCNLKLLTSDSDFKGKPNVILGKKVKN